ncbi:MAG: LysE family translocator [Sulfuritalea sp.]|nr:LysE family translocator [Sulfuritalea sp.]
MFEIQNYPSFIAAVIVFQIVPGPGTLAILNATARNGVAAGFGAVLGTLLGDFLFMVAAVAGLAAVLNANPMVFQGLQWFGAAYLCWIGLQLLRAPVGDEASRPEAVKSAAVYFRQACAVSLTNPKVVLFFVAFFPLFLRPDSSSVTLLVMMAHVTILSFVYQAGLVLLGNAVAGRLRGFPSARKIATRLAGIALVGFSIKLATSNR